MALPQVKQGSIDVGNVGNIANMMVSNWIGSNKLSTIAGITPRAARKAIVACTKGNTWRGVQLEARFEAGEWIVNALTLPPNLRDIWHERYQPSAPAVDVPSVNIALPESGTAKAAKHYTFQRWQLDLLRPALAHPKHSRERGEAIRAIASREVMKPNGKAWMPCESTLLGWINALENQGEQGLHRRQRRASPRVLISRKWDKACPLPEHDKARIAGHMRAHVASLWMEGAPGWRQVNQLAAPELVDQCRAAGWEAASLTNCHVGRPFVEKFRNFKMVAIREKNAKLFHDEYTPRIHRSREGYKPCDIVIGDVHPIDVVREIDGRRVHARLISWLDVATYDLFVTVVTLPPRRGIRQEDIARSFADMVAAWGLPRQLRLDNGTEYKDPAVIEGFSTLAGLVSSYNAFHFEISGQGSAANYLDSEQFLPISRAKPYNAQAKQIESVFALVESRFFALMPGWIGGDRMDKRTQNVGQLPEAHQGDDAGFARDVETALSFYRNTPQRDGSSPNQKWQKAIAEGWHRVDVPRETLVYAFGREETMRVTHGFITWNNARYYADCLIYLTGRKIVIRAAKWAPDEVFYRDDQGKLHAIPKDEAFDQRDGLGAIEQSRRAGVQKAHIRELKRQGKSVDLLVSAKRFNELSPPCPVLPVGATIQTAEGDAVSQALHEMQAPRTVKLLPGQLLHPDGHIIDIAPANEIGPKPAATDFDPMKFALPAPETRKPNSAEPEFDLMKSLADKHDEIRKDTSC